MLGLRRRVFSLGDQCLVLGVGGLCFGVVCGFRLLLRGIVGFREFRQFFCFWGVLGLGTGFLVLFLFFIFYFSWCGFLVRWEGGAWLVGALLGRWCCPCLPGCFG